MPLSTIFQLTVEEIRVPGENHLPVPSNWQLYYIIFNVVSVKANHLMFKVVSVKSNHLMLKVLSVKSNHLMLKVLSVKSNHLMFKVLSVKSNHLIFKVLSVKSNHLVFKVLSVKNNHLMLKGILSTTIVIFSYQKLLSFSVLTFIKWRLNTELLANTLRNVVFSILKKLTIVTGS
jgi:hypothetical protein